MFANAIPSSESPNLTKASWHKPVLHRDDDIKARSSSTALRPSSIFIPSFAPPAVFICFIHTAVDNGIDTNNHVPDLQPTSIVWLRQRERYILFPSLKALSLSFKPYIFILCPWSSGTGRFRSAASLSPLPFSSPDPLRVLLSWSIPASNLWIQVWVEIFIARWHGRWR